MLSVTTALIGVLVEHEISTAQKKIGALIARERQRANQEEAESVRDDEAAGVISLHETPTLLYTPEDRAVLQQLEARAKRLRQVQKLFRDDPELMRTVDATIANRLKAVQRRQVFISVAVALLSLMIGWLLPALFPIAAIHLLGH